MNPRGLADVSVPENHVWLLLLHKVILSLENFGKHFEKHEGFIGFENAIPEQRLSHPNVTKLRSFLCMLLLMTSIFVTAWNVYI